AGILFDRYTSEQHDIHDKKLIYKTLALFKELHVTYEQDGALWLKTTDYGDDKYRVLITSEETPTYFLADAGHYLETKKRGFDGKILILGPDHYGYVSRIQAAAKIVGLSKSDVIITQAVRLISGGKEAKMSKRKGVFVTFGELVEDVSADAARFFFLMISPDTHMDFDIDLAKEKSLKNPVFYAQYAYVRALSIIKKAHIKKGKIDLSLLTTEEDTNLMLKLAEFPEILEDTARDYAIHRVTRYVLELSKIFHNFYEVERVSGVPDNIARARLALVAGAATVLKNALGVLGVSTPKKM
ncbi:MAG: DALR anticodon-binding domain-containing protein, partial [Patescibacteria group bacterium]